MSKPTSIQLEDLLDFGSEGKTAVSKSQMIHISTNLEQSTLTSQQAARQRDEEILFRGQEQNDDSKYSCRHCPSSFMYRKNLNQHMRKKHPKEWEAEQEEAKQEENNKPFGCTLCQERFASYEALRQHRSRKHSENERRQVSILKSEWKCKTCFAVFPTRAELRKHEKECKIGNKPNNVDDVHSN